MTDRISCIIPTHKRDELLRESIDSAIKQTHPPVEVIVVDNTNNPSTAEVVRSYATAKVPVKYIGHDEGGRGCISRNIGVKQAKGDVVAFLDDDDLWDPEYLEVVSQAKSSWGVEAVYSWFDYFYKNEVKPGKRVMLGLKPHEWILSNPGTVISNLVVDKSVYEALGGFDEAVHPPYDKDFAIRLLQSGYHYGVVKEPLVKFRMHQGVRASNPERANTAGFKKFLKKHSIWLTTYQKLVAPIYVNATKHSSDFSFVERLVAKLSFFGRKIIEGINVRFVRVMAAICMSSVALRPLRVFGRKWPAATSKFLRYLKIAEARELIPVRTVMLMAAAEKLKATQEHLNYSHAISVSATSGVSVNADGTLLSVAGTNRYLKTFGTFCNEGVEMARFIEKHGIVPKVMLDVGANFGEVSLYFSRQYPECKVVAVEPAPESLKTLVKNIRLQSFPTTNLSVERSAVSSEPGVVRITRGLKSENSIVQNTAHNNTQASEYDDVPAVTLDHIFQKHQVAVADFIKIDIEGAEPMLADAIVANSSRIRSLLIEFSYKNTVASYLMLMKKLVGAGYKTYLKRAPDNEIQTADLEALLEKALANHEVVDIWFVKV